MDSNSSIERTEQPPYVVNVPGGTDYNITPLLSTGDAIPLLEGTLGNETPSSDKSYVFSGIPDGTGITEINGFYYVFVNHELSSTATTDVTGGKITGARVSLLKFNEDWEIVGGKNLIESAESVGVNYELDLATGQYKDASGQVLSAFNRFCSGYLAANGFLDADGKETPIWFAPEEGGSTSRGWAVTSSDGKALGLDGLGRYAKENVYAASQYRATNSTKTVLISLEDTSDGEIYMWVGDQTVDPVNDPNGFKNGDLYVLKVDGADYEGQVSEGTKKAATWTKVDKSAVFNADGTPKPTGADLSTFANTAGKSTNFQRLEDIAEAPNSPGTFYFVTTGTTNLPGTTNSAAATPGEAENPYGRLYRFSLNASDPTGGISNFELLLTGGAGKGVSYDNITADRAGNILLQEDETSFGGDLMDTESRDARVLKYNIAANEGKNDNDQVEFIAEINQFAYGEQFDNGTGGWETSGIVEAQGFDSGKSGYLFDVQAHGIRPTTDDGNALAGGQVEGGQLLLALPSTTSQVIAGNDSGDVLFGNRADNTIWGDRSIQGTSGGRDVIQAGRGNDIVFAGAGDDVVFGGPGEDGNDVLYGGAGNDILDGQPGDDRLFGNEGDDTLYGSRGDDLLYGGKGKDLLFGGRGADVFAIGTGDGTDTISDFKIGEDFIGLIGNTTFKDLTITRVGNNTQIALGSEVLANLLLPANGVLGESSFQTIVL
jgi:glycerophosphoryl diester phosphodiesterase